MAPENDLDGETIGITPVGRAFARKVLQQDARTAQDRRDEEAALRPRRSFDGALELIVRVAQGLHGNKDIK